MNGISYKNTQFLINAFHKLSAIFYCICALFFEWNRVEFCINKNEKNYEKHRNNNELHCAATGHSRENDHDWRRRHRICRKRSFQNHRWGAGLPHFIGPMHVGRSLYRHCKAQIVWHFLPSPPLDWHAQYGRRCEGIYRHSF